MKALFRPGSGKLCKSIAPVIFSLALILSIFTTWHVTGHILDSDASSEMVLAYSLYQNGGILSRDWMYSTELRVLNTQLIYAPLFHLFSDWHMVRFTATVIMQLLLVLSFGVLAREIALDRSQFFWGAAMLLLPVSVVYGRIVLYHCYYIPHIVVSFLITALVLRLGRTVSCKQLSFWVVLILLGVLSLLGGMGGIRQLMITHAPLLVSVVIFYFLEAQRQLKDTGTVRLPATGLRLTLSALYAAAASFAGLKINTDILSKYYTFENQAEKILGFQDLAILDELLNSFFQQFGFRWQASLISLAGILSVAGVGAGILCLVLGIRGILARTGENTIRPAIAQSMFVYYVLVMCTVFLITTDLYRYSLYLVLCLPWAVVLLMQTLKETAGKHWLAWPRFFAFLTAAVLAVNGLANFLFFRDPQLMPQHYEGLNFQETDKAQQLQEPIAFLESEGYCLGYATFWEGNIVTELTDGAIRLINVTCDEKNPNLAYYNWLSSLYLREQTDEKPFLLLDAVYRVPFEASEEAALCKLVYDDGGHCIYEILDHQELIPLLYS